MNLEVTRVKNLKNKLREKSTIKNNKLCKTWILRVLFRCYPELISQSSFVVSKFAPDGEINARLGWSICYGAPAAVYVVLWYLSGMPSSTFHLVTLATYLGHFVKRVLEALFLHKYSKKMSFLPATQVIIINVVTCG